MTQIGHSPRLYWSGDV